jgi:hypothetical protein
MTLGVNSSTPAHETVQENGFELKTSAFNRSRFGTKRQWKQYNSPTNNQIEKSVTPNLKDIIEEFQSK